MNSPVFKLYIKDITQYAYFCVVFYSMTVTLFVYSSVNRHLGCFNSGAIIMNTAAMNILVRIFLGGHMPSFLLGIYAKVELLGHRVYEYAVLCIWYSIYICIWVYVYEHALLNSFQSGCTY